VIWFIGFHLTSLETRKKFFINVGAKDQPTNQPTKQPVNKQTKRPAKGRDLHFLSWTNPAHETHSWNVISVLCFLTYSVEQVPSWKADCQPVKKFPAFFKPKGFLPHLQVHATCICPEISVLILTGYIANQSTGYSTNTILTEATDSQWMDRNTGSKLHG
jgi:hypothetical protein